MEYRFNYREGEFSNFYPSRFFLDGYFYDSVEMYVQSKCTDEEIKDQIMYEGLIEKFGQNKNLCSKLVKTANKELIAEDPHEFFWAEGSDGTGQNMLGELLMKVRDYYTA